MLWEELEWGLCGIGWGKESYTEKRERKEKLLSNSDLMFDVKFIIYENSATMNSQFQLFKQDNQQSGNQTSVLKKV